MTPTKTVLHTQTTGVLCAFYNIWITVSLVYVYVAAVY